MSYYIDLKRIGSVMRDKNYTDKEKVLLYIVSDHYQYCLNTGRKCELSYSLIKQRTGWANDTIKKTIKSLAERGDITADNEQLGGRSRTTTVFTSGYVRQNVGGGTAPEEGYSNNWNSTTPETGIGGTPETGENNNTKETTNNSTYTISTLSYKCESDFGEGDCERGSDTSFFDGGSVEPVGKPKQPKSELADALDRFEWVIDNNLLPSDVSFECAFSALKKKHPGLNPNYDYLKDRYMAQYRKSHSLSSILEDMMA